MDGQDNFTAKEASFSKLILTERLNIFSPSITKSTEIGNRMNIFGEIDEPILSVLSFWSF